MVLRPQSLGYLEKNSFVKIVKYNRIYIFSTCNKIYSNVVIKSTLGPDIISVTVTAESTAFFTNAKVK